MYFRRVFFAVFIFSSLFLAGCTLSIEEAAENTINAVEQTYLTVKQEANQKSDQFQYYLPPQFSVTSETNSNIVLMDKGQTYILFVNPFEPINSEVVYKSTVENYQNTEAAHTFSQNGEFGFVIIGQTDNNEELYELTVGVGGVKMTTVTDTNNMETNAKNMMEVVASVEITVEEN